jgi:hypothetical protein
VEEAVAEVAMAAGEEAVVAAVTLLFSPKGHGAGKGIRQGAHCRRAQLPHTHKATIPKSYRSQALYVLNVNPPLPNPQHIAACTYKEPAGNCNCNCA